MRQRDNNQAWSIQIVLFLIATFLILFECEAQAAESQFPLGCKISGFGFKDGKLVLKQETAQATQTVYFIHNMAEHAVHLHYIKDPHAFMSPSWSTDISGDNWSAFAPDKDGVTFRCKSNDSKIDCQEKLEVCQFAKAKFALSNKGDYWVASNKTQDAVVHAAVQKGILLR